MVLIGAQIVFVHGFGGQLSVWGPQRRHFVELGYRVLTYDHYGSGWSDGLTEASYGVGVYTSQLAELLYKLGWPQFHLVGASMGGGTPLLTLFTFLPLSLSL